MSDEPKSIIFTIDKRPSADTDDVDPTKLHPAVYAGAVIVRAGTAIESETPTHIECKVTREQAERILALDREILYFKTNSKKYNRKKAI